MTEWWLVHSLAVWVLIGGYMTQWLCGMWLVHSLAVWQLIGGYITQWLCDWWLVIGSLTRSLTVDWWIYDSMTVWHIIGSLTRSLTVDWWMYDPLTDWAHSSHIFTVHTTNMHYMYYLCRLSICCQMELCNCYCSSNLWIHTLDKVYKPSALQTPMIEKAVNLSWRFFHICQKTGFCYHRYRNDILIFSCWFYICYNTFKQATDFHCDSNNICFICYLSSPIKQLGKYRHLFSFNFKF